MAPVKKPTQKLLKPVSAAELVVVNNCYSVYL